jgi:hypothetical protein
VYDLEKSRALCTYIHFINFYDVKLVFIILLSLFAEVITREKMRGLFRMKSGGHCVAYQYFG